MRVACLQMNTRGDVAANVRSALALVQEAAAAGARLVALPETWAYKGGREGLRASAEAVDGPSNAALARLAARLGVFVLAGSIYEPSPQPGRVYNTSALFGADGGLRAVYRKIHLFDVIAGATVYRESDDVTPGTELVTAEIDPGEAAPADPAEAPGPATPVTLGLTICYDLRFPELYRALVSLGAEVLVVPAAFTLTTGKDHWHALLRARAIESQSWVVAPAQWGKHPRGRQTYGKTLAVDPWGAVVSEASEGEGLVLVTLDRAYLEQVRRSLPSLDHRRL